MNEKQIRAKDAEALLANPVFQGAINGLNDSLDAKILGMDIVNKDQCAKAVQAKQLVKAIEREIHRYIADGSIEDFISLEEEREKRKDNPRTMQR